MGHLLLGTYVSTLLIQCIKGTIYASVHRLGLSTVIPELPE